MKDFFLHDKTIVVTGASSGIGRQTAIACSSAGAKVVLFGRNLSRLEETRTMMERAHTHRVVALDFANSATIEQTVADILSGMKIHGMVHAAGISTTLPFRSVSDGKLEEFFRVNVFSALALTRLLTKPSFLEESGASVIFVASVMGVVGESGKTIYSATKGALISASRSMAVELAVKNVRVNCISPGVVVTPMTDNAVYSQDAESRANIERLHPLGVGSPTDVANAALYLLSDASRWVTGTNLIVDGGYTAR
jgi:NAD(P)-dependent dehydrogenase (short-subunit alcohol dehydrogenase family)